MKTTLKKIFLFSIVAIIFTSCGNHISNFIQNEKNAFFDIGKNKCVVFYNFSTAKKDDEGFEPFEVKNIREAEIILKKGLSLGLSERIDSYGKKQGFMIPRSKIEYIEKAINSTDYFRQYQFACNSAYQHLVSITFIPKTSENWDIDSYRFHGDVKSDIYVDINLSDKLLTY
jgi:hypothetical protein